MFDSDDRTHSPTPLRRQQARQQGRVVTSRHLTGALVWLLAAVAVCWWLPSVCGEFAEVAKERLANPKLSFQADEVFDAWWFLLGALARWALPPLLIVAAVGTLVQLLQTGWLWQPERVVPDWSRIHPGSGVRRIFGRQTLWESLWLFVLVLLVIGGAWWMICEQVESISLLAVHDQRMLPQLGRLLQSWAVQLGGILLAMGGVHYALRWWQFEQSLKMSQEELRAEIQAVEINPLVASGRDAFQRRMHQAQRATELP